MPREIVKDTCKCCAASPTLHDLDVAHLDMKPSNIVIDGLTDQMELTFQSKLVIIDLGFAHRGKSARVCKFKEGTRLFQPPEVRHYHGPYECLQGGRVVARDHDARRGKREYVLSAR